MFKHIIWHPCNFNNATHNAGNVGALGILVAWSNLRFLRSTCSEFTRIFEQVVKNYVPFDASYHELGCGTPQALATCSRD